MVHGRACRWSARQAGPRLMRLRWIAMSTALALASCGGHPKDVLLPVADTAPNSSKVEMLVATTRKSSTVQGEMFSGERGLAPAFANITVSIPPKTVRKEGDVAWPKRLPSNPATDFATLKARKSRGRGQEVAERLGEERAPTIACLCSSTASTTGSRIPSTASRRSSRIPAYKARPSS
jgi:hypothetical protein